MTDEDAQEIAAALRFGFKEIGKEGAAGPGALEYLAIKVDEGAMVVAEALNNVAEAIREHTAASAQ